MIKKNKKTIKPMSMRQYVGEKNIEKWLLDNYTFTDKHTFISGVQLFDEFNKSFSPFEIPVSTEYDLEPEKLLKCYVRFWVRLNDILIKLNWKVKEGFLYYTDDNDTISVTEDSDKIQGIFKLLKKKDVNKKIIEAPTNNIIDIGDQLYYEDVYNDLDDEKDSLDFFDFKNIETRAESQNFKRLMDGYPYSDEYIHGVWDGYPTIYRYWRIIVEPNEENIDDK